MGVTTPARPVVVGIDDSPAATAAAAAAVALAGARKLPVRLVRAAPGPATDRDAARLETTGRALARALPPGALTTALVEGHPGEVLLRESRTAALLVVAPSGDDPGPRAVLSRVLVTLLRGSACPVLVHRPGTPHGPVVAGVDGGPRTEEVLAVAAAEAVRVGASLQALHIWGRPELPWATPDPRADEAERAALADRLAELRQRMPDLPVTLEVVHGDACAGLVRAARHAALLVLGRTADPAGAVDVPAAVCAAAAAPVLVVGPDGSQTADS